MAAQQTSEARTPWHSLEDHVADRPAFDAKAGDLAGMSARTWDAVVAANDPPVLFRRGGVIVRGQLDDFGLLLIQPVDPSRLRHRVARVSLWHADGEPIPPPMDVIKDMMASPDPPLPVLDRIVRVPIVAPDGSVRISPGYDRAARTLFHPSPRLHVPDVTPKPTPRNVARAVGLITDELLGDFPFTSPAERANAVALGLHPFCRALIDGPTPLHVVEKPSPGTGATLLVDMLTFISTGSAASTMTEGSSEEEWRKRLTAKLLSAPEVVLIDNVRARLGSAALASAITTPTWEDRQLGRTHMLRLPVRCAWVATGNSPTLTPEMARRSMRIRLDAHTERPWLRTGFRHPRLKSWVVENHGELVWAFLTLVMAWVSAGFPPEDGPEIGMFECWSQTIGGHSAGGRHRRVPRQHGGRLR